MLLEWLELQHFSISSVEVLLKLSVSDHPWLLIILAFLWFLDILTCWGHLKSSKSCLVIVLVIIYSCSDSCWFAFLTFSLIFCSTSGFGNSLFSSSGNLFTYFLRSSCSTFNLLGWWDHCAFLTFLDHSRTWFILIIITSISIHFPYNSSLWILIHLNLWRALLWLLKFKIIFRSPSKFHEFVSVHSESFKSLV